MQRISRIIQHISYGGDTVGPSCVTERFERSGRGTDTGGYTAPWAPVSPVVGRAGRAGRAAAPVTGAVAGYAGEPSSRRA
ncbi:hypothetical protein F610DRAFT_00576 [Streptomyces sp. LaPpAH-199]|nr:hypothetical protein F610DRAFT_00576 [Streptomyces sp. LaPpAH-199]